MERGFKRARAGNAFRPPGFACSGLRMTLSHVLRAERRPPHRPARTPHRRPGSMRGRSHWWPLVAPERRATAFWSAGAELCFGLAETRFDREIERELLANLCGQHLGFGCQFADPGEHLDRA